MTMFGIGDEVSWTTMMGDTERGSVTDIDGDLIRVEYGPWADSFWGSRDKFTLVFRASQRGRRR